MRVRNTQAQKSINNVFLKLVYLLWSFILGIIHSLKVFVSWSSQWEKRNFIIYRVFDFVVWQWPKEFLRQPSGYKVTKYIGDFIHHIFLKK